MHNENFERLLDLLTETTDLVKSMASEPEDPKVPDEPDEPTEPKVPEYKLNVGFAKDIVFGAREVLVTNSLVSGKGGLHEAISQPGARVEFSKEVLEQGLIVDKTIRSAGGAFVDFKGMTLLSKEQNLSLQLVNDDDCYINFVLDGRELKQGKTVNGIAITEGLRYILDNFAVLGYTGDDSLSIGSKNAMKDSADLITIGRYFSDAGNGASKTLLVNCDVEGQRTAHVTVHDSYLNGVDRQTRNSGAIVHSYHNYFGPDRKYGCSDCTNNGDPDDAYQGIAVTISESNYFAASPSGKNDVERTWKPESWQGDSVILTDGKSFYEDGCRQKGNVIPGGDLRDKYVPYAIPDRDASKLLSEFDMQAYSSL